MNVLKYAFKNLNALTIFTKVEIGRQHNQAPLAAALVHVTTSPFPPHPTPGEDIHHTVISCVGN